MEARGVPTSRNHSFWTVSCPTKDGASSFRAELKREEERGGVKKVLLRVLTMRRGSFTFTRNLCDSFFLSFSLGFLGFFRATRVFISNLRLLTVVAQKRRIFVCYCRCEPRRLVSFLDQNLVFSYRKRRVHRVIFPPLLR